MFTVFAFHYKLQHKRNNCSIYMDCRLLCQATVQYSVIRSTEELATSLINYNLTTEAERPSKPYTALHAVVPTNLYSDRFRNNEIRQKLRLLSHHLLMKLILFLYYVFILTTKFQTDIMPNLSNYGPLFAIYNLI